MRVDSRKRRKMQRSWYPHDQGAVYDFVSETVFTICCSRACELIIVAGKEEGEFRPFSLAMQ